MLKLLPYILDFATKRLKESLYDDKNTNLDKVVKWLISDRVSNSINSFHAAYMAICMKLKNEEEINKMIENSTKDLD